MKKTSKILATTLLGMAIVGSSVYAATDSIGANTIPDKAAIQEMNHFNKIQALTNSNQMADLEKYVANLSEKELFEAAAEMIEAGTDFERDGMILVPYIKEKWKNGPSKDAYKLIADKDFSDTFRMHVLDAMFNNELTQKSLEDKNIVNEVTTLINDTKNDDSVRAYALKKLRASDNIDHAKLKLDKIVFNNNESSEVRGSAIIAMHRTDDPAFEKTIDKILKPETVEKNTNYEGILDFAIIEAAKGNLSDKYMKEIQEIAKQKNSLELNSSISYAMSINGGKDAVKLTTELYDAKNKEIAEYTLRTRMYDVMDLLNSTSNEDIKIGIKASIHGQIANALPKIKELKQKSTDAEIKKLADEAMANINPNDLVDDSVLKKVGK